jgi:hypothetical protein
VGSGGLADHELVRDDHDLDVVAAENGDVVGDPVTASALRVIGRGSYGEYPPGRFVTCAELAAYES